MPKPYPTGASHPVDAEWRAKVEEALEKKGWTRKRLAEEIGCDPSAITVVMRPSTVQSRLRVMIDATLGIEDPALGELDAELLRAIRGLDDASKRHMLALVERMLEVRKGTAGG